MNKKELAAKVARQTGLTLSDTAKSIDAVFQTIKEEVVKGSSMTIKGFGSFSVSNRSERRGVNPSTKEPMTIPARKAMKFKPCKGIKIK